MPIFEKQLSKAGPLSIIENAFFFALGQTSALKQLPKKIADRRFLIIGTV